jgi:hypothetical protein
MYYLSLTVTPSKDDKSDVSFILFIPQSLMTFRSYFFRVQDFRV